MSDSVISDGVRKTVSVVILVFGVFIGAAIVTMWVRWFAITPAFPAKADTAALAVYKSGVEAVNASTQGGMIPIEKMLTLFGVGATTVLTVIFGKAVRDFVERRWRGERKATEQV